MTKARMQSQAHIDYVYNLWKHICLKNMCNKFVSSLVCHGTAEELRFSFKCFIKIQNWPFAYYLLPC